MNTLKVCLILIFVLTSFNLSFSGEKAGEVQRYKGKAKIYREGNLRGEKVKKKNTPLFVKDIIKTKRKAMAHIIFIDGSEVFMKGKTILEVEDIRDFGVNEGRVIFNIKKQRRLKSISIRTKSIVIGVKGTTFCVDLNGDDLQLFLKEGELNVQSIKDEFVRYRKKEEAEYENYKEKEADAFAEFKESMEEEFKEFVKEFEMKGGTAISISDNEVRDIGIPDEIEKDFMLFNSPDLFDEL